MSKSKNMEIQFDLNRSALRFSATLQTFHYFPVPLSSCTHILFVLSRPHHLLLFKPLQVTSTTSFSAILLSFDVDVDATATASTTDATADYQGKKAINEVPSYSFLR